MDDIINEIVIKRMIAAGVRHPILDLIRELDEFLLKTENVERKVKYGMV